MRLPRRTMVSPRSHHLDGLLIALAALAAYLALRQDTLYYTDGHSMLAAMHAGDLAAGRHQLAQPIFRAWQWLSGLPPHLAITSIGAASTALAVWITHRIAMRMGLGRSRSALAAAWVACVDPIVFFATVVEFHGLYVGVAAATFWVAFAFARAPSISRAVGLGIALALGSLVHLTGIAWGFAALVAIAGFGPEFRSDWRRRVVLSGLAIVVQVAVWAASIPILEALGWSMRGAWRSEADTSVVVEYMATQLLQIPAQLWKEWFVPYLPLSAMLGLFVFWPRHRFAALAMLVAAIPYAVMSALALLELSELGAYLTPLVIPAALILVRWLPIWAISIAIGTSALLAVSHVLEHDGRGPISRSYVAELRQLAADADAEPFAIVLRPFGPRVLLEMDRTELDEFAACLQAVPHIATLELTPLALTTPELATQAIAFLPELIRMQAAGRTIYLGRATLDRLADRALYPGGAILAKALRDAFDWREVGAGVLAGFTVRL